MKATVVHATILMTSSLSCISCGPSTMSTSPLAPPNFSPPQSSIAVPGGNTPVMKLKGEGIQIYSCQEISPGKFDWKLDRPEAALITDDGQPAGKHYKGPTWEANDGSKVMAALDLAVDAPYPSSSIKWFRLKATSHENAGTFAKVSYI